MKLAVFLPNWIGDAAMATPTLRALRRHLGNDATLIGIARPAVAECLAGTTWLDEIWPFVPRAPRPLDAHSTMELAWRLRQWTPDSVLLLTNSFRTALVARLSGAPRRVGYHRFGRRWLLTERLFHKRQGGRYLPTPVLDDYLRLAYQMGCAVESPWIELATSDDDRQQADVVWQRLGFDIRRPVVALNSSGAFGAAKLWPSEHFAELARRIANNHTVQVLVLCGPSERPIARKIVELADHAQVKSLADEQLSIGLSKASIARSRLLVTTDSGPRHFAAAFDVPVITLFGPTHIAWSETHYSRAVHMQEDVPCGPCQQRVCPLEHHRCMRDLSVERVFAAVRTVLDSTPDPVIQINEHAGHDATSAPHVPIDLTFAGDLDISPANSIFHLPGDMGRARN